MPIGFTTLKMACALATIIGDQAITPNFVENFQTVQKSAFGKMDYKGKTVLENTNAELGTKLGRSDEASESKPHVKYDVLINHWHLQDFVGSKSNVTKLQDFVARLRDALSSALFRLFLNEERPWQSRHFVTSIDEELSDACVHVTIFSQRYAQSTYCLEELCYMLQSRKVIIPVFYDVKPEDLRRIEKGPVAEDLRNHEKPGNSEMIQKWKQALHEISGFPGFTCEMFNGDENQMIRSILAAVCDKGTSRVLANLKALGAPEKKPMSKLNFKELERQFRPKNSSLSCRSNFSVDLSSNRREYFGKDGSEEFPDNIVLMPLEGIILLASLHNDINGAASGLYHNWFQVDPKGHEARLQAFREVFNFSSHAAKPGVMPFNTHAKYCQYLPDILVSLIGTRLCISSPRGVKVIVGTLGGKNPGPTATSSALKVGHANVKLIPQEADGRSVVLHRGLWEVVGAPHLVRSYGESYHEMPEYELAYALWTIPIVDMMSKILRPIVGLASMMWPKFSTDVLQLTTQDDYVIVGTNAFWDWMSASEAMDIVRIHGVRNNGDPWSCR